MQAHFPPHVLQPPHSQGIPFLTHLHAANTARTSMNATTAIDAISSFPFLYQPAFLAFRNIAHRQNASAMIAATVQTPKPKPIASIPNWYIDSAMT